MGMGTSSVEANFSVQCVRSKRAHRHGYAQKLSFVCPLACKISCRAMVEDEKKRKKRGQVTFSSSRRKQGSIRGSKFVSDGSSTLLNVSEVETVGAIALSGGSADVSRVLFGMR